MKQSRSCENRDELIEEKLELPQSLRYFNMMTGEESVWFTTAGAMLEDAQRRSFIGPLQKAVYLHRYKRLCRRRAK